MILDITTDSKEDEKKVIEAGNEIITSIAGGDNEMSRTKLNEPHILVNAEIKNVDDKQVRRILNQGKNGVQVNFENFKREGSLYIPIAGNKNNEENKLSASDEPSKIIVTDSWQTIQKP